MTSSIQPESLHNFLIQPFQNPDNGIFIRNFRPRHHVWNNLRRFLYDGEQLRPIIPYDWEGELNIHCARSFNCGSGTLCSGRLIIPIVCNNI